MLVISPALTPKWHELKCMNFSKDQQSRWSMKCVGRECHYPACFLVMVSCNAEELGGRRGNCLMPVQHETRHYLASRKCRILTCCRCIREPTSIYIKGILCCLMLSPVIQVCICVHSFLHIPSAVHQRATGNLIFNVLPSDIKADFLNAGQNSLALPSYEITHRHL